jgi:pimeloyl-ACP methyl ester carboxylesterase
VLAVLAALTLTGCAMFQKLDVGQIHQESAAREQRNPVIFVHGFIGSKLKNRYTHESVWGRFINAVKRGRTEDLGLPIDAVPITHNRDDLIAYSLYERVAGVKFYGAFMEALTDVGGYRLGDINNPQPGDTLFIYYYDWRRDNVESAIGLGRAIRQIKARLKAPDMRFDILAHSMGGLVAEYYLRYGMEDVIGDGREHPVTYAGAPDIGRMILIGTPLRGTMSSFRVLNKGFSRTMSPEVVFTMPSIYQLLPHDGRGRFVDPQGDPIEADLYDAGEWVRNGWSIFNTRLQASALRATSIDGDGQTPDDEEVRFDRMRDFLEAALARAEAFHLALQKDQEGGSPVPIHLFGSDCIPTLDRVVLKQTPGGTVTLFDDERAQDKDLKQLQKVMLAPGDGTVTTRSLLALGAGQDDQDVRPGSGRTFASTFFFCESHGMLPTNRSFQDNMFYVLFHSPVRPTHAPAMAGGK